MTWYFDSNEPVSSVSATKDDFGDSLNRTIAVGGHPLGFSADFVNGLLYEPRVTLGALGANDLLYGGQPADRFRITEVNYDDNPASPSVTLVWNSQPGANYVITYSSDLQQWEELDDSYPSDGETTTFTHEFVPDFVELVGAERLYYRVSLAN